MLHQLRKILITSFLLGVAINSSAQTELSEEELLQSIVPIETALKKIADAAKQSIAIINAEPTDVKDLQRQLGRDKETLRLWVAENVRWVPYAGALKGAEGVFQSRQGNSLDQALLLQKLFTLAGHESQLQRAEVPITDKDGLFKLALKGFKSAEWLKKHTEYLERHDGLFVRMINERFAESPDTTSGEVSSTKEIAEAALKSSDYYDNQLSLIKSLLPELGQSPKSETVEKQFMAELGEYYWVRTKDNDGEWVHYSTLHAKKLTEELTSHGETLNANALPDNIVQTVQFKVIVDATNPTDNKTTSNVVFDHEMQPYKHGAHPIAFQMQPSGAMGLKSLISDALENSSLGAAWTNEFQRHNAWVPTLVMSGDNHIRQNVFTPEGDVFKFSEELFGGIDDATRKQLGNAIDALNKKKVSAEELNYVSAVRQVWTITAPRQKPKVIQRFIYQANSKTVTNPEHRNIELAQTMARQSIFLLQSGRIPRSFVELQLAEDYLQQFFGLRYLMSQSKKQDKDSNDILSSIEKLDARLIFPKELLVLAVLRNHGLQSGFLSETNILMSAQEIHVSSSGEKATYTDEIDIVNNISNFAGSNNRESRLDAGVWDTVAESTLMRAYGSVTNTVKLLYDLPPEQFDIIEDLSDLNKRSFQPSQYLAMSEDIKLGYWLITPKKDVSVAGTWWRVNPNNGETLGQTMIAGDVGGATWAELTLSLKQRIPLLVATFGVNMAGCVVAAGSATLGKTIVCSVCAAVKALLKVFTIAAAGAHSGALISSAAGDAIGLGRESICLVAGVAAGAID